MNDRDERMIQFHLEWFPMPCGREREMQARGELVLMRISAIMCLFPEHRQIRTIEHGWTVTVCEEDWEKVEKSFRSAYPEHPVVQPKSLEQANGRERRKGEK